MTYKFRTDEPVRDAVIRCANEQLDAALHELRHEIERDPVHAVHDARKAIKKERSLLRLVRGSLASEERRRSNVKLRTAARGLSATRDADVMRAAVDELADRFAGQLPSATFDAVRAHLSGGHGDSAAVGDRTAPAIGTLEAVRRETGAWQLRAGGWAALQDGLATAYKRGRRAQRHARRRRRSEDLHAWRKRVKDLWYHERLLAPACGRAVRGHAEELHRLADLLGDDHDLAMLRAELDRASVAADVDAVITLIDHRRGQLQAEAFGLGDRIYAEKPKAFARRMRRSWTAGRAMSKGARERPAQLAAATREPHLA